VQEHDQAATRAARPTATKAAIAEVQHGLARTDKLLPCKFFYDGAGSELFERICELPEYYLTRTELQIVSEAAGDICAQLGPRVRLVEFGSGSSTKTRILLDRLVEPTAYVPVDIASDMLSDAVATLRAAYPRLCIEPLCCDYAAPFALPPAPAGTARTVCFFPGSTIGNFETADATAFLRRVAGVCGRGGLLLIGVDLQKDVGVLLPAYNDAAGVTAEFNRNMLRHLVRVFDCDLRPEAFEHRAIWNGSEGRIEMQLICREAHTAHVAGSAVPFRRGEVLTTEYSHKYTLPGFAALAASAGFTVDGVWLDAQRWFSVQLLRVV